MPVGLSAKTLQDCHSRAIDYEDYLALTPEKAIPWRENDTRCELTEEQQAVLASFIRKMNVIVLSGIWCGDCSSQGPMLSAIARGSDMIDLRWIDRDSDPELTNHLAINQGHRVPTVLFLAEDFEPVSVTGDRTLSRYRAMAHRHLGSACDLPTATTPEDEFAATLQEWLNEFERVQLLLRLSTRLRKKHGD